VLSNESQRILPIQVFISRSTPQTHPELWVIERLSGRVRCTGRVAQQTGNLDSEFGAGGVYTGNAKRTTAIANTASYSSPVFAVLPDSIFTRAAFLLSDCPPSAGRAETRAVREPATSRTGISSAGRRGFLGSQHHGSRWYGHLQDILHRTAIFRNASKRSSVT
jgi:hypothetical protein